MSMTGRLGTPLAYATHKFATCCDDVCGMCPAGLRAM
jgi:hypothetical protein